MKSFRSFALRFVQSWWLVQECFCGEIGFELQFSVSIIRKCRNQECTFIIDLWFCFIDLTAVLEFTCWCQRVKRKHWYLFVLCIIFVFWIQQQQQQPFYGPLSGTTRVSRYQKKHSPTQHPDHHAIFISFFHLPWSIASYLFKLRAWRSFCTTSFHVIFGLPLGLETSTSYSIHFFTQLVSSFRSTCPYHPNLFCCSINIISSLPSLSLNSLLGTLSFTLTLHIHLTILISARWSATSFSFLTGQVSLPCSILLCIQLLYSLPLLINDISLLVSNGTHCLNLFHPIRILASTAASASPSTLNISPR